MIRPVILAPEGNALTGAPVHEVGIGTVIAARTQKQLEHAVEALESRFTCDPASLRCNDQSHDSEAGAADRDRVRDLCALAGRAPVQR